MFGVYRNLNLTCICDREILMAYTHKTHAVDNDGHIISNADFDFYIDEVARLFCTNYDLIFWCLMDLPVFLLFVHAQRGFCLIFPSICLEKG
jgi:hypothetical protein